MVDPTFYATPGPGGPRRPATTAWSFPTGLCYPEVVRLHLSVLARPHPVSSWRTSRSSSRFSLIIPHSGWSPNASASSTFVLKLPIAPPPAGGQAGLVGGGDDRQPPGAGGWAPVRGRRTTSWSTCPGRVGASAWTRPWPSWPASSAGGYFEYHGEVYGRALDQDLPDPHRAAPHPGRRARHPGPATGGPVRRLAPRGEGIPEDLPGLLAQLDHLRQEEGTADRPFEVHVISLDAYTVDGIQRLEEQGVTGRDRRLPLAVRRRPRHRGASRPSWTVSAASPTT